MCHLWNYAAVTTAWIEGEGWLQTALYSALICFVILSLSWIPAQHFFSCRPNNLVDWTELCIYICILVIQSWSYGVLDMLSPCSWMEKGYIYFQSRYYGFVCAWYYYGKLYHIFWQPLFAQHSLLGNTPFLTNTPLSHIFFKNHFKHHFYPSKSLNILIHTN